MMFIKKMFSQNRAEQKVIETVNRHIQLLCKACDSFKTAMETNDRGLMRTVIDIEREGDSIRREIISTIYEGAFLPYLRRDICKFVEILDSVFDVVEDAAFLCMDMKIPEHITDECIQVAFLNAKISEMLLITFEAMLNGEDLREKTLAIRIYEKKIDDIKFSLIGQIRKIPVSSFWEGKTLSDFITSLTGISDIVEDASDHLQIINLIMRT